MSLAAAPRPFQPLQTVPAGLRESQRLRPTVDEHGEPVWQAGDTNVWSWPINSVGWSRGVVAGRQDSAGIRGLVYLSDARVIVVSDRFTAGSRFRAYGIGNQVLLAAAATKVSRLRARRAASGSFLTGQMRLPWLTAIVFGHERGPKAFRGEVRLCGQQPTGFGDPESVLLIVGLKQPEQTHTFVNEVIARVRGDRHAWQKTTDEQRAKLDAIPPLSSVSAEPGQLPRVPLAGAYRIAPASASYGVHSVRSYPQEQPGADTANHEA